MLMRIASLAILACTVSALVACGGNSATPAASPTTVEAAVETAQAPASESAAPAEPVVVRAWRFHELPKSDWEWYFPGGRPDQTERGAWYTAWLPQTGPEMRGIALKADSVDAVRVHVAAWSETRDAVVRNISFYWSREGDEWEDGWPYTNAQRVFFEQDEANPFVWMAYPSDHPAWDGTVNAIYIRYTVSLLPTEEDGDERPQVSEENEASVITRRIQLIK